MTSNIHSVPQRPIFHACLRCTCLNPRHCQYYEINTFPPSPESNQACEPSHRVRLEPSPHCRPASDLANLRGVRQPPPNWTVHLTLRQRFQMGRTSSQLSSQGVPAGGSSDPPIQPWQHASESASATGPDRREERIRKLGERRTGFIRRGQPVSGRCWYRGCLRLQPTSGVRGAAAPDCKTSDGSCLFHRVGRLLFKRKKKLCAGS